MNKTDAVYQAYCKTKFPLPKEKEIAALEHQLSLRFPRTYRAFLKAFNGSFFCHPVIAFPEPITVKWRDKMVTHVDDELLGMNGLNATIASYELGD